MLSKNVQNIFLTLYLTFTCLRVKIHAGLTILCDSYLNWDIKMEKITPVYNDSFPWFSYS